MPTAIARRPPVTTFAFAPLVNVGIGVVAAAVLLASAEVVEALVVVTTVVEEETAFDDTADVEDADVLLVEVTSGAYMTMLLLVVHRIGITWHKQ